MGSPRILVHGVVLGAIGFAAGFLGPICITPQANQGPLFGILTTSPGAFLLGLHWGWWREGRSPLPGGASAPEARLSPPRGRS